MKRHIPLFGLLVLCALLAASCRVGGGFGVGSGGSGMGLGVSTDLSGSDNPATATANNKLAMNQFNAGNYENAAKIYQDTLDSYPENADAKFYLGLSQIGMGEREKGFDTLATFKEPDKTRTTQDVQWWAAYMRKKGDASFDDILKTMEKVRREGLAKDEQEERERLKGLSD